MSAKNKRLTVVRARFSLDFKESVIDEIIASFSSLSSGKLSIEVYRQIGLTRDIQWMIFTAENHFPDEDQYCDRLISALSEYCTVDRTDWQIV